MKNPILEIRIKTDTIQTAAANAGQSAEEYIAHSLTLIHGRVMCAHLKEVRGAYSVFVCK